MTGVRAACHLFTHLGSCIFCLVISVRKLICGDCRGQRGMFQGRIWSGRERTLSKTFSMQVMLTEGSSLGERNSPRTCLLAWAGSSIAGMVPSLLSVRGGEPLTSRPLWVIKGDCIHVSGWWRRMWHRNCHRAKMEEAECLPPQSGHHVMPGISVPLEGILPESHMWCVCVCVEGRGRREYLNKIFSFLYFTHSSEWTPPFTCLMLLLNNYLEAFDIWNPKVTFCCL